MYCRKVQTVVCQRQRATLGENLGQGKPHLGIFSCHSVNIWVGIGRAAALFQLLYNRLAFQHSSRLTGYWSGMECWPQGPVSVLSGSGY